MRATGKTNSKFIPVSFSLIILIVIAAGYFLYIQGKEAIFREKYNDLSAISRLKIAQITNWRKAQLKDAHVIIQNPFTQKSLIDFVQDKNPSSKNNLLELFRFIKRNYRYEAIYLVGQNNNILISASDKGKAEDEHVSKFLEQQEKSDSMHMSDLHFFGDKPHFSLRVPIKAQEQTIAYLILIIDPEVFLFPMIQSWPSPSKTAETLLIRKDGDQVLFLNELRHKKNTALKLRIPLSQDDLPAAMAIKGYEGSVVGFDYRGEKVIADIRKVRGTNWFIVAKVDEQEISSALKDNTIHIVIAMLLGLAVVLFLLQNILKKRSIENLQKQLAVEKEKQYISAHLRLINYYANDAMITTDRNYKITYANRKAQEIYGYAKDELMELHINDLVAEPGQRIFNKITDESVKNKAVILEIAHKKKDGTTFPSESSITFLEIGDEKFSIAIIRDIAERKRAEFQINKLTRLYSTLSQVNQSIVRSFNREELFAQITEVITKYGKFDASMIMLKEADQNNSGKYSLKVISESGKVGDYFKEIYINATDDDYFPAKAAIDEGKIIIHNSLLDIGTEHRTWLSIARKHNIYSCAAVPIKIYGEIIGVLGMYTSESSFFEEEEIKLIDEIIGDIAFALERFDNEEYRHKAEQLVFENERKLSTLIKNLQGIVYRCKIDKHWTMEFISEGCLKITGYTPSDFLFNKNIAYADIIHPEDRDYVSDTIDSAINQDKNFTLNYRILCKKGNTKWVWERGVGIKDSSGKLIALEGFINDITESKKAEEELIIAKNKAESGDRLKSEFLAQMSHEIRTPINVILSFSTFIKDSLELTDNQDILEGFNAIHNASSRLIRTIDSLLNMSQIQLGSFEVKRQSIDLRNEIIDTLYQEFKSLAKSKKLQLEVLDNNPEAKIYGDIYSVNQLLDNLIHNAIKYTDKGKISIIIDQDTSDRPVVSIRDTGIGIKKEYIPYLFDAFSQEETGYTRKFEGTGLGLALVKNYCYLNKAEINVESEKGVGTTFTVTFQPTK